MREDITSLTFVLAACIPDACSPSDIFDQYGIDVQCETKNENKKLDAADIVCV